MPFDQSLLLSGWSMCKIKGSTDIGARSGQNYINYFY